MLNLDTHILIDFLRQELRDDEDRVLEGQAWGISGIVLWQLFALVQQGRVRLDLDDPELNRDLGRIHVWPISVDVCRQLRRLDFRSDPADEIIAATSIAYDAPLLTRHRRMLGSKVVPLALAD
ncbi:MAG: PIN domain-containing protein [Hyphomicrobiales bacterium]